MKHNTDSGHLRILRAHDRLVNAIEAGGDALACLDGLSAFEIATVLECIGEADREILSNVVAET